MAPSTRIGIDADGNPTLTRHASAGPDARRLERELAIVHLVDHPGVLAPHSVEHHADGAITAVMPFLAGGSLGERSGRHRSPAEIAELAAAVAETLAHAHAMGVVHGALEPGHVLLDRHGHPLVTGWGRTQRAGVPSTTADDVGALGSLLTGLLEHLPDDSGTDGAAGGAASLRSLAARASAPSPRGRPSMAAVAGGLRAVAHECSEPPRGRRILPRRPTGTVDGLHRGGRRRDPGGRLRHLPGREPAPRKADDDRPPDDRPARGAGGGTARGSRSRFRSRAAIVAGLATGAGAVAFLGAALLPTALTPADPATERPPSTPPGTMRPEPAPPAVSRWRAAEVSTCYPVPAADGDDCGPPALVEGGTIETSGARWTIGASDDVVFLGEWGCHDAPTPAVLRPATGELWVFPRWAGPGDEVTGRAVGVVPHAVSGVAIDPDVDGCHEIGVTDSFGRRTVLDPGPP